MSKISELPAIGAPTGTETVVVLAGGVAKRVAVAPLVAAAGAPVIAQAEDAADRAEASAVAASAPILGEITALFGPVNLLNPATVVDGVLNGGVLQPDPAFWTSDFIKVENGGQVISNRAQISADPALGMAVYRNDRTLIGIVQVAAATPVQLPAGSRYVRFSQQKRDVLPSAVMVSPGAVLPVPFRPYGLANAAAELVQMRTLDMATARRRTGLFDRDRVKANTIISATDGEVVYPEIYSSGFIPVTPGGKITLTTAVPGIGEPFGLAWYDRTGVLLPGGVYGPFTKGQVLSPPANALYMRISLRAEVLDTFDVLDGEQTPQAPARHKIAFLDDAKPWAGKAIGWLGDSILAQGPVPADVCRMLGATVGLNATVPGRVMSAALYTAQSEAMTKAHVEGLDGAVLALGTNDFGFGTPLGAFIDPAANVTNNFTSATRYTIETLLTWNPYLRLFVATLLPRDGYLTNPKFTQFAGRLRDLAAEYSLPVIDQERTSGINNVNMDQALYDRLHPNVSIGYNRFLTPMYAGAISRFHPRS